jgi:hypothetical protein
MPRQVQPVRRDQTNCQLLGVNRDSRLEIKFDSVEDVNVS